jgi:hypothetical protein
MNTGQNPTLGIRIVPTILCAVATAAVPFYWSH